MTYFTELENQKKNHMETLKTLNSPSNPEQEKQGQQNIRFQDCSETEFYCCECKHLGQQNRIENPEINPCIFNLTFFFPLASQIYRQEER